MTRQAEELVGRSDQARIAAGTLGTESCEALAAGSVQAQIVVGTPCAESVEVLTAGSTKLLGPGIIEADVGALIWLYASVASEVTSLASKALARSPGNQSTPAAPFQGIQREKLHRREPIVHLRLFSHVGGVLALVLRVRCLSVEGAWLTQSSSTKRSSLQLVSCVLSLIQDNSMNSPSSEKNNAFINAERKVLSDDCGAEVMEDNRTRELSAQIGYFDDMFRCQRSFIPKPRTVDWDVMLDGVL